MTRFEAPRGTHDILPAEQPLWRHITGELERLCRLYGYRRIQTPVFEDTELFARTSGQGSDVVAKEMYTFTDRSDRSLTLRPEGTAPICRSYLQHGLHREPQPQKLYTIGTMYRYGRPGRGRYREHWHASVEAIGSDDPALDAEVIHLYDSLLRRIGVRSYHLELNSIGDRVCRPAYLTQLRAWLDEHEDELDDETRDQARRNPLRALDNLAAKPSAVQAVLQQAPAVGDALCDACRDHFSSVRRYLDALGVAYELVPTLVRGLDYYTRTTWEFVGPEAGAQSVVSGGGRYDGLIEEIGGEPTPGVGFGAGIERLLLALEDDPATAPEPEVPDLFFLIDPDADRAAALAEMAKLRAAGVACDTDYAGRSPKGQRTQLSRSGARGSVHIRADGATVKVDREAAEIETAVADVAATVLQ